MSRNVCMLMFIVLVAVVGCEQSTVVPTLKKVTSEDMRRDVGQAAETTAEYSRQAKQEFEKKFDARLKDLDVEIAKLREKGRDLKDEAKANWDRKMADLDVKRDTASVKLDELGHSSAEAWKDAKNGAESAWNDLDKACHVAASEFRE